jgi:G3E family GTPase
MPDDVPDLRRLRKQPTNLPRSVLRVKGFVRTTAPDSRFYLVQCSGALAGISEWSGTDDDINPALVFIGTPDMPGADQLSILLAAAADHS